MNWNQVAVEAGYKDRTNAKAMGGRLLKKLTGASAASAPAADGDYEEAGEGSSKAGATAAGKKRKAAGAAQGDASPVKGEILDDGFGISTAPNLLCSRSCREEAKGYEGRGKCRGQGYLAENQD